MVCRASYIDGRVPIREKAGFRGLISGGIKESLFKFPASLDRSVLLSIGVASSVVFDRSSEEGLTPPESPTQFAQHGR